MALTDNAVPITELNFEENEKIAIVFGSEGGGISKETLAKSDHIAIIPMHGGVDSLNVAASSAVAFWELCKKTE
jgi:tRNA G18 (ribose-2'-O)-methylase SpoU